MTLLAAKGVITPDGLLEPGWVEIAAGLITTVGAGQPPRTADVVLDDAWVLPGFVDLHVHGGGGHSFQTGDPDEAAAALGFHRWHGTTTSMASLVSASMPALTRAIHGLAEMVDDGLLAGVHLEGPWISDGYCGAHDRAVLRSPDDDELPRVLRQRPGVVRMVTVAPELDGGIDAVRRIVAAGAIAAIGHTAATFDVARAALTAGATVGTHLFNAMPALLHRAPGPVGALLGHPSATVELITDGVHVHPGVVSHVVSALGASRVAIVTDAIAAAGVGDGTYRLGGLPVQVRDGVARLDESDTVAGSTLTMDRAVRWAVQEARISLVDAAIMASTTPAAALDLKDRGALRAGLRADLVVLDPDLHVRAVMRAGAWVRRDTA